MELKASVTKTQGFWQVRYFDREGKIVASASRIELRDAMRVCSDRVTALLTLDNSIDRIERRASKRSAIREMLFGTYY